MKVQQQRSAAHQQQQQQQKAQHARHLGTLRGGAQLGKQQRARVVSNALATRVPSAVEFFELQRGR